jgi:uncharacterized protein (DUF1330 family)
VPYLQVFFVTLTDPQLFARYAEAVVPIVARHGCGLDVALAPQTVVGLPTPTVVNLTHCPDEAAFRAFDADPAFQAIVGMRSASCTLASVSGTAPGRVDPATGDPLYTVEIARFGPDGARGYERYLRDAERAMGPYGYRVVQTFVPTASSGLPFAPDRVTIARFAAADGFARFHDDPAHAALEAAYPTAVAESVWAIGRPAR